MSECPACGGSVEDDICRVCGCKLANFISDNKVKKDLTNAIVSLRSAQLYDRNREDMLSTLHNSLSVLQIPVRLNIDTEFDLTDKEKELLSIADQLIEHCDSKGFITIQRPEIYLRMGNAFYAIGDTNKALHYFEKISRDYPRNKDALFNKALTLFSMEDHERALKVLNKLLEIDPELQDAVLLKELVKQMYMG